MTAAFGLCSCGTAFLQDCEFCRRCGARKDDSIQHCSPTPRGRALYSAASAATTPRYTEATPRNSLPSPRRRGNAPEELEALRRDFEAFRAREAEVQANAARELENLRAEIRNLNVASPIAVRETTVPSAGGDVARNIEVQELAAKVAALGRSHEALREQAEA